MTDIIKAVAAAPTSSILALVLLALVVVGSQLVTHWLKGRMSKADPLEDRLSKLMTALVQRQTEELTKALAESAHQRGNAMLELFLADRKEMATAIMQALPECMFADENSDKLVRLYEAHMGDGTRRSDGSLRWQMAEGTERTIKDTNDKVTKLGTQLEAAMVFSSGKTPAGGTAR